MYRKELLKGSTETILLALLVDGPMYGYQLVEEMDTRSSGYFRFKEGTLYPALHRLARDELIEGSWQRAPTGQARRYYYITAEGRKRLASMLQEWGRFTTAINLVAHPEYIWSQGV
jgi:PadR family transcriptional regulator PadR